MAGDTPKVRAVVDVEDDAIARRLGNPDRLVLRRGGRRARKVSAGHDDGARAAHERVIDVILTERAVGAILPVKNQWKGALIAHAEKHEGGQAVRINPDAAGRDTLARQLLNHKPPHCLIAYAGD